MSQDDDEHVYVREKEITFQRRLAPKEMYPNSSGQVVKVKSTWNDGDITKINSKIKVINSIVAVLLIAILTLSGVLVFVDSQSGIYDNDLKELLVENGRTLEGDLTNRLSELRNESRTATRTSEINLIGRIEDAISSLNTSRYELLNGVTDNRGEIYILREELNKRNVADCSKVDPSNYKSGNKTRGVFEIYVSGQPIDVFCDLGTYSGNWTVIQRRMDGSVDFFRNHAEYVVGFGSAIREYWIGLQNLYNILQSSESFELRIDMEDWDGVRKFAQYSRFDIGPPQNDYVLRVSGYSGTAGDFLIGHSGFRFSTKDHDVDADRRNCANVFKGAWWYNACHSSNLNGLYHEGGTHASYADGINWGSWTTFYYSLKFVEMKIKQTN